MRFNKIISTLMCTTLILSNILTATASNVIVTESPMDENFIQAYNEDSQNEDWGTEESNFEQIEVTYSQASNYSVTIPKLITLDSNKRANYSVKVTGDIRPIERVYVSPVDAISSTENFDFYMKDTYSKKDDVPATITHNKFYWDYEDVANSYEETSNLISAPDLSAGTWKGTFEVEIKLQTDKTHVHDYTERIITEPTCTEDGEKELTCTCGDKKTVTIPATGHNYGDDDHCTECGELNTGHEHHYTEKVIKEPTCTEDGEKELICSCGDKKTVTIPATGHNYGDDNHCTECGELNTGHEHHYTERIIKEPTCTEDGEKELTCSCGDKKTETIPATGHNYGDDDHCTECGELDSGHEHHYTEKVTKPATCTEDGEKELTCSCGDKKTVTIPATGHNYGDDDHCTECGELKSDHEHDYTITITKTPTCTEDGERKLTCKCGDTKTERIPATGHDFRDVDDKCEHCGELNPSHVHSYSENILKEATCTETGSKKLTCKCGDTKTETISALGHNYSSTYTVDKEATCLEEGSKSKHCTRCGAKSEVTSIPMTEHNYEKGTCTICGEKTSYEIAPASASGNWNYTLDDTNDIITLNYYTGNETDVIVYANYEVNDKLYKTQLSNSYTYGANVRYMFNGYVQTKCKKIQSIIFSSLIDTSNVTGMVGMFYECNSLSYLDISCFNTSNVTNMSNMFTNCNALTYLDLSHFDVSNVTNMSRMFFYCTGLTSINLENWDTSKVTTMKEMFFLCRSFRTLDLSNLNTSNVTNMYEIFGDCGYLNTIDLRNWDTRKVTDMWGFFSGCTNIRTVYVTTDLFSTSQAKTNEFWYKCPSSTKLTFCD